MCCHEMKLEDGINESDHGMMLGAICLNYPRPRVVGTTMEKDFHFPRKYFRQYQIHVLRVLTRAVQWKSIYGF